MLQQISYIPFIFTTRYVAHPQHKNGRYVWHSKSTEGNRPCGECSTSLLDPVPKRDIYSIMYILFFFDSKSVQLVSKHCHFTIVCYAINVASKIHFHQQQRTRFLTPVPTCALVRMTMFRNVLVININAMETDKDSDYFKCPVAKLILIMQNDIFSIILIHEVDTIYDFIKCCLKSSNYHQLNSNDTC